MKIRFIISFAIMVLSQISLASAEVKTVANIDLGKFAKTWYRIASNPSFIEEFFAPHCNCARQVLTPYQVGTVTVYNSCRIGTPQGRLFEISGLATVNQGGNGSKLSAYLGQNPWPAPYWVIVLDPDYRYAVVANDDGKYLYVMSATPFLEPGLYEQALAAVRALGVSTAQLVIQNQIGCKYPPAHSWQYEPGSDPI